MDFARAFTYITDDRDWFKKIGIAALISFTGVGMLVVAGWGAEIIKRVKNDEAEPLPSWENFGDYLINGVKLLGVFFIWSLPILLLTILISLFAILPLSQGTSVQNDTLFPVLLTTCTAFLSIAYAIVIGILGTPLLGLVSEESDFKKLLNPKLSFNVLKSNFFGFLVAFLLGSVISSILSSIGVIVCFVGSFFGYAFGYAVMSHLLGQAFAQAELEKI